MENIIQQWSKFGIQEDDEQTEEDEMIVLQTNKRMKKEIVADFIGRNTGFHYTSVMTDIYEDEQRIDCRRSCIVCSMRTSHICVTCNVYCCNNGLMLDNCYYRLHKLENFKYFFYKS